jgi:hypothetical protein
MDRETAAARYPHGTRARYQLGGCKCYQCQFANCEYERVRAVAARGPWCMAFAPEVGYYVVRNRETKEIVFRGARPAAIAERDRRNARDVKRPPCQLVGTAKVRRHVARLRAQGVGYKRIAQLAGVNRGVLARIIKGDIESTRRAAADRILAVRADQKAAGAKIDAAPTWELLDRLIAAGYPRYRLARWLGSTAKVPALQVARRFVTVAMAQKVRRLYDALTAKRETPAPTPPSPAARLRLHLHQESCWFYAEGASSRCKRCTALKVAA